jgi:hypothetical protein
MYTFPYICILIIYVYFSFITYNKGKYLIFILYLLHCFVAPRKPFMFFYFQEPGSYIAGSVGAFMMSVALS